MFYNKFEDFIYILKNNACFYFAVTSCSFSKSLKLTIWIPNSCAFSTFEDCSLSLRTTRLTFLDIPVFITPPRSVTKSSRVLLLKPVNMIFIPLKVALVLDVFDIVTLEEQFTLDSFLNL